MLRLVKFQSVKLLTSRCASTSAAQTLPHVEESHSLTDQHIEQERKHGFEGKEKKMPVVVTKAKGIHLWDVEGRVYYDFLSGSNTTNQGHSHPRLVQTMQKQASQLALTSQTHHNDVVGEFQDWMAQTFNYSKVLPLTTSTECHQTAIQLALDWAQKVKGINAEEAKILTTTKNQSKNFVQIPFNNLAQLEIELSSQKCAAFLLEPIQTQENFLMPEERYLQKVRELCTKYNVLMIVDESQTSMGRTGRMLYCEGEEVRPDVVMVGNGLAGGLYPISAILTDEHLSTFIQPTEYSNSPLGCKLAIEALKVIKEENLCDNAEKMGIIFRRELRRLPRKTTMKVYGQGLLNAIVVNPKVDAWEVCLKLKENGILTTVSGQGDTIQFAPSLTIKENQVREATQLIIETLYTFNNW